MALINIDTALLQTLRTLKKLTPPAGVQLLSYKRNRKISITKEKEGILHVQQTGYDHKTYRIPESNLAKLLKTLFKKEFPRSRKIRLLSFTDPEELKRNYKKI